MVERSIGANIVSILLEDLVLLYGSSATIGVPLYSESNISQSRRVLSSLSASSGTGSYVYINLTDSWAADGRKVILLSKILSGCRLGPH